MAGNPAEIELVWLGERPEIVCRPYQLSTTTDNVSETLDSAETLAQDVRDGRTEKIDQLNDQLDLLEGRSAEV